MWLERHGYDVVEAPDGAAALEILDRESVDMIISDMNMPGIDGVELARIVREERGIDVPLLLLTARCDQGELAARVEPYRVHVYPKPFVPSRLVADIDRLLAAHSSAGGGTEVTVDD
jgi:CheY-like chemotaxis protein